MDYIAQLKETFSADSLDVDERMKHLEISLVIQASQMPPYDQLFRLIDQFPKRDTVTLFFTDDSDRFTVTTAHLCSSEQYADYVSQLTENETVHVMVTVDKQFEGNKLSVYCYRQFADDLLALSIPELLAAFAELYQGNQHLYFEVLDTDLFFQTGTMVFSSSEHTIAWTLENRQERLDLCQSASCFYHQITFPLLPEDFKAEVDFEGNPLTDLFSRLSTILSLAYLSSTSSICNGQLSVQITGQKNLEDILPLTSIKHNPCLYSIYYWIFNDGNAVDKALLARNSISSHCRSTNIAQLDGKTLSSIQANYNLYLKKNVEKYIDLTNAMAGFICDTVDRISDCLAQLFNHFKTNLIAFLSFLFTTVLANVFEKGSSEHILTEDIVYILYIVLGGSFVYFIVSIGEVIGQKQRIVKQYNDLVAHYQNTLSQDDIDAITNNGACITQAQQTLKKGILWRSVLWLLFILFAFVMIDLGGDQPHIIEHAFSFLKQLFG